MDSVHNTELSRASSRSDSDHSHSSTSRQSDSGSVSAASSVARGFVSESTASASNRSINREPLFPAHFIVSKVALNLLGERNNLPVAQASTNLSPDAVRVPADLVRTEHGHYFASMNDPVRVPRQLVMASAHLDNTSTSETDGPLPVAIPAGAVVETHSQGAQAHLRNGATPPISIPLDDSVFADSDSANSESVASSATEATQQDHVETLNTPRGGSFDVITKPNGKKFYDV